MGLADSVTYDVITRYRVENQAGSELNAYTRATERADRATNRLHTGHAMLARSAARMARAFVPIAGGLGLAGVAALATRSAFRNLNEEMNSSLQLGSQINLAFQFSTDPVENFNRSVDVSRGLIRGLVSDAAKLPGELSDFISISRQISGAVFAGGGDVERVRGMTARLALAAPAAGATSVEAGRQAMRALFGTASVGDNPLFAMLQGTGLIPNTTTFNAMTAAQRLDALDNALAKLTDNPMFRKRVIETWDTQLGTLADNLVGMEGVFGRLARGPFDDFLHVLIRFNDWLERNGPELSRRAGILLNMGGRTALGLDPERERAILGRDPRAHRFGESGFFNTLEDVQLGRYVEERTRDAARNEMLRRLQSRGVDINSPFAPFGSLNPITGIFDPEFRREYQQILTEKRAEILGAIRQQTIEGRAEEPERRVPQANITQHYYVKLDLKSDDAPDAMAIKLTKALAKVGRHPTTVQRGISAIPGMSSIGNP